MNIFKVSKVVGRWIIKYELKWSKEDRVEDKNRSSYLLFKFEFDLVLIKKE